MATNSLTQTHLKRLVTYDPLTGEFTRLLGKRAGHPVGSKIRAGYTHIFLTGQTYKAHRLAWLYVYGMWPNGQIDHINHNRSDNRIANLRDVTCSVNHQNRNRHTKSKSGVLGVTWHARDRRWQAHIEVNGKAKHLGSHVCLGVAIKARLAAEAVHHPHRHHHANTAV